MAKATLRRRGWARYGSQSLTPEFLLWPPVLISRLGNQLPGVRTSVYCSQALNFVNRPVAGLSHGN